MDVGIVVIVGIIVVAGFMVGRLVAIVGFIVV
jgi:hypothetical protein